MKLRPAIPVLRIFDYELARAFYVDWLGFRIEWLHRFSPTAPRVLQISRDGAVLRLSEHYGDGSPGANVSIETDDVAALHRELHSRPNPNMNPGIEDTPWNSKLLGVVDPFGNRINFDQPASSK